MFKSSKKTREIYRLNPQCNNPRMISHQVSTATFSYRKWQGGLSSLTTGVELVPNRKLRRTHERMREHGTRTDHGAVVLQRESPVKSCWRDAVISLVMQLDESGGRHLVGLFPWTSSVILCWGKKSIWISQIPNYPETERERERAYDQRILACFSSG